MNKLLRLRKILRISLLMILAISIAGTIITWSQIDRVHHPLKGDRNFTQQPLGITHHLLDLGVVDINDDNWLDIFTVNHSARQRLLINNPSLEFKDQLVSFGLSQNSMFPGAEPSNIEPLMANPGLYIYWNKAELVIRAQSINRIGSISGAIQLADWVAPASVVSQTQGELKVSRNKNSGDKVLNISALGDGQLILSSRQYTSIDCTFNLDKTFPLDSVYIGPEKISPTSHQFNLVAGKDRHGMAWADFYGDDKLDVFIARGGASGTMKLNSPGDKDELFIQKGSVFQNITPTSGLIKQTCPARQVASVDFNQDDKLDLFIVCGRNKPPRQQFPNQLHQQIGEGVFSNVALEKGLDMSDEGPGSFLWFDAEKDGDMDLLWANYDSEFWLYLNDSGQFTPKLLGKNQGKVKQLTMADYNNDGSPEVFAASPRGNTVVTTLNGVYNIIKPSTIGLPDHSVAANWVDYDNDGLVDLHTVPNGVYRQHRDHTFETTGVLEMKRPSSGVLSTWFDADNDGSRDLLIAVKDTPLNVLPFPLQRLWDKFPLKKRTTQVTKDLPKSKLILYQNKGLKKHWLQLKLIGKPGNRQAIGARVEVKTPDGVQFQQVGQSDGSIQSQGHYRLYFGLGNYNKADSVKIIWPDRTLTNLKDLDSDRLFSAKQVD